MREKRIRYIHIIYTNICITSFRCMLMYLVSLFAFVQQLICFSILSSLSLYLPKYFGISNIFCLLAIRHELSGQILLCHNLPQKLLRAIQYPPIRTTFFRVTSPGVSWFAFQSIWEWSPSRVNTQKSPLEMVKWSRKSHLLLLRIPNSWSTCMFHQPTISRKRAQISLFGFRLCVTSG